MQMHDCRVGRRVSGTRITRITHQVAHAHAAHASRSNHITHHAAHARATNAHVAHAPRASRYNASRITCLTHHAAHATHAAHASRSNRITQLTAHAHAHSAKANTRIFATLIQAMLLHRYSLPLITQFKFHTCALFCLSNWQRSTRSSSGRAELIFCVRVIVFERSRASRARRLMF